MQIKVKLQKLKIGENEVAHSSFINILSSDNQLLTRKSPHA